MNYLKALGVFRLVAGDTEHGDPAVRGMWRGDRFALVTCLDRDQLLAFFLEHYRPTPVIGPWGARSGFYPGPSESSARDALNAIVQAADTNARLAPFRDALRAFAAEGLRCLHAKPKTPKTVPTAWPKDRDDDLRALLHQSPRTFGKPTSLWTLPLAAEVCHEKGWTPRRLSGETIRLVLKRLGVGWKRAKHWLTSPDPAYAQKKNSATG